MPGPNVAFFALLLGIKGMLQPHGGAHHGLVQADYHTYSKMRVIVTNFFVQLIELFSKLSCQNHLLQASRAIFKASGLSR